MAEATAEIYVIDLIARLGGEEDHRRLLAELKIQDAAFESVEEIATRPGVTLREMFHQTSLRYNEICAVIAVLINGFEM